MGWCVASDFFFFKNRKIVQHVQYTSIKQSPILNLLNLSNELKFRGKNYLKCFTLPTCNQTTKMPFYSCNLDCLSCSVFLFYISCMDPDIRVTRMTYQHLQHVSGVRIDLNDLLIQSRDLKQPEGCHFVKAVSPFTTIHQQLIWREEMNWNCSVM